MEKQMAKRNTAKRGKRILYRALLAVALLLAVLALLWAWQYFHRSDPADIIRYETTNPYIQDTTEISAHRSGAGIMPEETMMAFENCVENPAFNVDFFEFDLHITRDDVLVLLHDDVLDRTSDCEMVFGETDVRPEDKTYAELRQLNMGAKFETAEGEMPYADLHGDAVPDALRILRLEDILDYLSSHDDYRYIIEVKNEGELGRRSVDILYEALTRRGMLDDVVFGCFHEEVSDYVDEAYPEMRRGAYASEVTAFYLAALLDKQDYAPSFDVLQLPFGDPKESYGLNLATARLINYAHKNNLGVQYWTINDEEDMAYLIRIGADCIMSDYPDQLSAVRSELESR